MQIRTILKGCGIFYIVLVVTAQSLFFMADRFLEKNLSRVESFSGNISNKLKDAERLAFLLALGMIENEAVLPFLEEDLKLRGLPQYSELVSRMKVKN